MEGHTGKPAAWEHVGQTPASRRLPAKRCLFLSWCVQTGTTRDVPAAFGSQAMRHPLHKALETDPPSPAGTTRSAEPSLCFAGRSVPAYLPGEPQQLSAGSEKPPGVPALERAAAVKHGGIPQHNLRMERASRHSGGQRCPAWGGCL